MKRLLIYQDKEKIKQAKDFTAAAVRFMQLAYEKLNKAGLQPSIEHLAEIGNRIIQPTTADNWLIDYITYEIGNGADIKALGAIKGTLTALLPKSILIHRLEPNLIVFADGKFTASPTANSIIENRFSFFTQNEKGDAITKILQPLAESLNEHRDFTTAPIMEELPNGIELNRGIYRPDIGYIRDYERSVTRSKTNERTYRD